MDVRRRRLGLVLILPSFERPAPDFLGSPRFGSCFPSAPHDRASSSLRPPIPTHDARHRRRQPGESLSRTPLFMILASSPVKAGISPQRQAPDARSKPVIPPAARDAARLSGSSYDAAAGQSHCAESTSPPASPVALASPSRRPCLSSSSTQRPLDLASESWRKDRAYREDPGRWHAAGTEGAGTGDTMRKPPAIRVPTLSAMTQAPSKSLIGACSSYSSAQRLTPCTSQPADSARRPSDYDRLNRRPQSISRFEHLTSRHRPTIPNRPEPAVSLRGELPLARAITTSRRPAADATRTLDTGRGEISDRRSAEWCAPLGTATTPSAPAWPLQSAHNKLPPCLGLRPLEPRPSDA